MAFKVWRKREENIEIYDSKFNSYTVELNNTYLWQYQNMRSLL